MARIREMRAGEGDISLLDYDLKAEEEVSRAERVFNERMFGQPEMPVDARARMLAFVNKGNGEQVPIKRFDHEAEEIVLMPMIVGG